jgi:hypothetical protein
MVSTHVSHWAMALVIGVTATACGASSSKQTGGGGYGGDGGSSGSGGESIGGNEGNDTLTHTEALTIEAVTAAVVGIHGDDLAITVKGVQKEVGTVLSLEVTLLDASSKPITFFDTDLDGRSDPGAGRLVLEATPTTKSFVSTGTIFIAGRLGTLKQVSARLISKTDGVSNAVTTKVIAQPIVNEGESCDPKGILNRCAPGTGCTGSKPKCSASIVPRIEDAAYVKTTPGARVIAVGSDTANPLTSMNVEFFDKSGKPAGFDTTSSGTLDTSFISKNGITNSSGTFLWRIDTTSDFASAVPRLKLTPNDAFSVVGPTVTVDLADVQVREDGAACDVRGFDVCRTDSLCWPNTSVTAGTCQTLSIKQSEVCSVATTLRFESEMVRTVGYFNPVSLWSPPVSCSTPNSLTAPDAMVHLKVLKDTPKLLISTKTPETNVATVLYVLESCNGSAAIEQCSDRSLGAPSAAAELELSEIVAGDYYVVIENLDTRQGSYGLTVSIDD